MGCGCGGARVGSAPVRPLTWIPSSRQAFPKKEIRHSPSPLHSRQAARAEGPELEGSTQIRSHTFLFVDPDTS